MSLFLLSYVLSPLAAGFLVAVFLATLLRDVAFLTVLRAVALRAVDFLAAGLRTTFVAVFLLLRFFCTPNIFISPN